MLVAEGVEAQAELDMLVGLGVRHMQGFLLCPPCADPPAAGFAPPAPGCCGPSAGRSPRDASGAVDAPGEWRVRPWWSSGGTHPGLRRPNNEDSAYVGERLLVVADGMGGVDFGEVASAIATHAVTYLDRCVSPQGPRHDLAAAVEFAEYRLGAAVQRAPELAGMGTTMTALLLDDDVTALAHVGDSRAYRLRDGVLEQVTRDHTFVQMLVEIGRPHARGGRAPPAASRHRQGPAGRRGRRHRRRAGRAGPARRPLAAVQRRPQRLRGAGDIAAAPRARPSCEAPCGGLVAGGARGRRARQRDLPRRGRRPCPRAAGRLDRARCAPRGQFLGAAAELDPWGTPAAADARSPAPRAERATRDAADWRVADALPRSFLALGDSFTEGMQDELGPDGRHLGWADRVAAALATATGGIRYANLAIRGRLLDQVVDEQLPVALELRPDLMSFHAGPNDALRPRTDLAAVLRRYDATVGAAPRGRSGRSCCFTVLERAGGTGRTADRLAARFRLFNDGVRAAAARHGALLVDVGPVAGAARPAALARGPAAPRTRGSRPGRGGRARDAGRQRPRPARRRARLVAPSAAARPPAPAVRRPGRRRPLGAAPLRALGRTPRARRLERRRDPPQARRARRRAAAGSGDQATPAAISGSVAIRTSPWSRTHRRNSSSISSRPGRPMICGCSASTTARRAGGCRPPPPARSAGPPVPSGSAWSSRRC